MNRYKRAKTEVEQLRKERDYWKLTTIHEIENDIADPSGAVSENEIIDRMCKHTKVLQQALKEG